MFFTHFFVVKNKGQKRVSFAARSLDTLKYSHGEETFKSAKF